jgi:hypothetical protein
VFYARAKAWVALSGIGNPTIRLVLLARVIALASAPVTLLLVAALRSPAEQGFYFVFVNVQAVAVLFELGVGSMLVQFAAHASRHLTWTKSGELTGDEQERVRFWLLLDAARRWFAVAGVVVLGVVFPAGLLLFENEAARTSITYAGPWAVLTVALGGYLTAVPFICVLEGSGQLYQVQRMRLRQVILTSVILWALIPTVGSLNAIAVASVASAGVTLFWLVRNFPTLARRAVLWPRSSSLSDTQAPLRLAQGHAAIGWIVGFLGPQLLSPIVLRFQGAAGAGRVGLTLAAASAPLMLSLSWLQARYPEYGAYGASKDLARLDAIAKHATFQAVVVCASLMVALLAGLMLARDSLPWIASRFLPTLSVTALCCSSLAYLLYQAMAARLRAHREESLLWPVVVGTGTAIIATIVGARISVEMATFAYSLAVVGVLLPLSVAAFMRRHRQLTAEISTELQ